VISLNEEKNVYMLSVCDVGFNPCSFSPPPAYFNQIAQLIPSKQYKTE